MRLYSNNEPCHLLVPLFKTVSVTNPPTLPYSALKSWVITRYSSIASGEIDVFDPPWPHCVPQRDTPPCPCSLLSTPSTIKLPPPVRTPLTAAPRAVPPACCSGTAPATKLTKSLELRASSGIFCQTRRSTKVERAESSVSTIC